MARPRGRKKVKNPSSKVSRRVNKRRKRVAIKSDPLVAAAWDRKLTLCQNYARLGLVSRANFASGGVEPERKPLLDPTEDGLREEEQGGGDDDDLRERLLADDEAESGDNGPDPGEPDDAAGGGGNGGGGRRKEKTGKENRGKRKIDPSKIPEGMGFIERDEEGNVVYVVIGTKEEVDPRDVEELPRVPAKTKLVQQLEERAANALKKDRHQSAEEKKWIRKLIEKHGEDYEKMFWDKKLNVYQQTVSQLRRRVHTYLESIKMKD